MTSESATDAPPSAQEVSNAQARVLSQVIGLLIGGAESEMYSDVLDLVRSTFESRFGFFGYIDEEGSLICPSMTRDIFEVCNVSNKSIVFPRSLWGGLWGRILVERRSMYKNEAHQVPQGHLPLRRSLGAPVIYQGELIGSIHVADRERDYTDADLGLMETIASVIAPVLAARLERDRHAEQLRAANAELERVNRELAIEVGKQREMLLTLATPVIQVWDGVLVAPIVGALDGPRMTELLERLLELVTSHRAAVALIDLTGLPTVDAGTAQHLFNAAAAVRLLGAQVVLTGVRPSIAQTVVSLGLDLSGVTTKSSLAAGLRFAFDLLQLRVVKSS